MCAFSGPVSVLPQIRPMGMVTEHKETFGRLLVKKMILSLITCLGNESANQPKILSTE